MRQLSRIMCAAVVMSAITACGGASERQDAPAPAASALSEAPPPAAPAGADVKPVTQVRQEPQTPANPARPEPRDAARPAPTTGETVNNDAAVLADFNARLQKYLELQRDLADDGPKLKETKNPAEIRAAQDVLAAKIRNVRSSAKHGDIFTPQISALFKRLAAPPLTGPSRSATRETLEEEDGEVAEVWLRVNVAWPESEPLTTVPANLLERLPQLPMDVEYRITAKRHLVLRDVDANLIVDYIYNALP